MRYIAYLMIIFSTLLNMIIIPSAPAQANQYITPKYYEKFEDAEKNPIKEGSYFIDFSQAWGYVSFGLPVNKRLKLNIDDGFADCGFHGEEISLYDYNRAEITKLYDPVVSVVKSVPKYQIFYASDLLENRRYFLYFNPDVCNDVTMKYRITFEDYYDKTVGVEATPVLKDAIDVSGEDEIIGSLFPVHEQADRVDSYKMKVKEKQQINFKITPPTGAAARINFYDENFHSTGGGSGSNMGSIDTVVYEVKKDGWLYFQVSYHTVDFSSLWKDDDFGDYKVEITKDKISSERWDQISPPKQDTRSSNASYGNDSYSSGPGFFTEAWYFIRNLLMTIFGFILGLLQLVVCVALVYTIYVCHRFATSNKPVPTILHKVAIFYKDSIYPKFKSTTVNPDKDSKK